MECQLKFYIVGLIHFINIQITDLSPIAESLLVHTEQQNIR